MVTFHFYFHGVGVSGRGDASEESGVVFRSVENRQSVFELGVTTGICGPPFRIFSIIVTNGPFRVPESPNPQTLHMQDSPRVNDQLSVVRLSNRTQLMPKQYSRGFFHRVVVLLV